MKQRVSANPLVGSTSLPAWATVQLDALIGSGVVDAHQLDGLTTLQLLEIAAAYVKASAAAEPFDADEAISTARSRSAGPRYDARRRAA